MIDKINSLIGKPYNAVNYHCFHLVKELQPKAPDIDVIASQMAGARLMNGKVYSGWEITDTPHNLDIVLLGTREDVYHHAGVLFEGGIVHADKPSVRYESLSHIKKRYPCIRYYTYRDSNGTCKAD